jgi:hypothetical protein
MKEQTSYVRVIILDPEGKSFRLSGIRESAIGTFGHGATPVVMPESAPLPI